MAVSNAGVNRGGAEERTGVGNGVHPAIAREEIQAEREERRDQDLAGEIDIKIACEGRQQEKKATKQGGGNPFHAPTRPNKPWGRNAMTKIIGRNTVIYASSGNTAVPNV